MYVQNHAVVFLGTGNNPYLVQYLVNRYQVNVIIITPGIQSAVLTFR